MNMTRKSTDAQLKASRKYDQQNTRLIQLKLNKKTDSDILDFLDGLDNRQGYIKELIRKQISGEDQKPVPVIEKKIVSGEFLEGKFVTVSIDGKEFRRKVHYSEKWGDLIIVVFNNEYAKYEFEG